jgi:hypothetical protein
MKTRQVQYYKDYFKGLGLLLSPHEGQSVWNCTVIYELSDIARRDFRVYTTVSTVHTHIQNVWNYNGCVIVEGE